MTTTKKKITDLEKLVTPALAAEATVRDEHGALVRQRDATKAAQAASTDLFLKNATDENGAAVGDAAKSVELIELRVVDAAKRLEAARAGREKAEGDVAAAKLAEHREQLAAIATVPALVAALEPVISRRREIARLQQEADELQRAAVERTDAARKELGVAPLPFSSDLQRLGAHAIAAAIVADGTHVGPKGPDHFATLGRRIGGGRAPWPGDMAPADGWAAILAGVEPKELNADAAARFVQRTTESLARSTAACSLPIERTFAAVREIEHGRKHGSWARPDREEQLVTIATSPDALVAALDLVKKGPGWRSMPGKPGDHILVPPVLRGDQARAVCEILGLDKIGVRVREIPKLPPLELSA